MKKAIAMLLQALLLGMLPIAAVAAEQSAATAQAKMAPIEQYLMDRDAEIALARTAAPASISNDATVLVLTRKGYETAVEGKNGFVCLVDRGWQAPFDDAEFGNPKVRAPTCLNPQAARSVLPMQHKRTQLALGGASKDEIESQIISGVEKKEFPMPEVGAMSYMMSKEQHLADRFGHWHPHLMFYLPVESIKLSDWGANLPKSPVMGGETKGKGDPVRVFIVPVSHWSDDTPAPAMERHEH
jgi:hypothetical protein